MQYLYSISRHIFFSDESLKLAQYICEKKLLLAALQNKHQKLFFSLVERQLHCVSICVAGETCFHRLIHITGNNCVIMSDFETAPSFCTRSLTLPFKQNIRNRNQSTRKVVGSSVQRKSGETTQHAHVKITERETATKKNRNAAK